MLCAWVHFNIFNSDMRCIPLKKRNCSTLLTEKYNFLKSYILDMSPIR